MSLGWKIIAVMFPVFAVVALGYLYGRFKRPDMRLANNLNMDVFVPALVFAALSGKDFDFQTYGWLALAATLVVLGSGLLAWPLLWALKLPWKTYLPPIMFGNSGNMGLPLAVLAFGENALPGAVMMFLVSNVLHYGVGTWILAPKANLKTLLKEPVIIAAIAGFAVSACGIQIWPPLHQALQMTGEVSIPLLLFALGVRLISAKLNDFKAGALVAVLCPMTGIAIASICVAILPLNPEQVGMIMVFGALPPAVLNFVFAEKYNQNPAQVASMVMVGNLASLGFVALALYWVLS